MSITRLSRTEYGRTLPFNLNISSGVVKQLEGHFSEMLKAKVPFEEFYWPSAMAAIQPLVEQYGDSPELLAIALDEISIDELITSANAPASIRAVRWSILDIASRNLCSPTSNRKMDRDIYLATAEVIGEVREDDGKPTINYDRDGVVHGRIVLNKQRVVHEYLCRTIPFNDDDSRRPDYEWPIHPGEIFFRNTAPKHETIDGDDA
ncbi:hypothetical protein H6770_00110 [Candidatus Peribacteria bacterium]|nr:hypothetical protein [Candidatus Peribacteria bacterium]